MYCRLRYFLHFLLFFSLQCFLENMRSIIFWTHGASFSNIYVFGSSFWSGWIYWAVTSKRNRIQYCVFCYYFCLPVCSLMSVCCHFGNGCSNIASPLHPSQVKHGLFMCKIKVELLLFAPKCPKNWMVWMGENFCVNELFADDFFSRYE